MSPDLQGKFINCDFGAANNFASTEATIQFRTLTAMGRTFRAARVRQVVASNLESLGPNHQHAVPPPWLDVLERIPPSEILTRPAPIRHQPVNLKLRRPHRTFVPEPITYIEDELRSAFFKDHPWELARPRIIMELDGKDARYLDWSTGLLQPGIPLTGER